MKTADFHLPTVVLYSHDGYGLGHVSRTVYLAQQIRDLQPDTNIIIVTSSPAVHRVSALRDFEYVKLPSVTKTGVERYRPHHLRAELGAIIRLRSNLLLSTIQNVRPDVFLVDHRPLGLKREVEPALEWLREHSPRTRVMVGLRDVIDEPDTVIHDWRTQGIYDALDNLYDDVLVYGSRSVLDSTREYALPGAVSRKVSFTGYLGRKGIRRSREAIRRSLGLGDDRFVVVHGGGGGDAGPLIEAYLDCVPLLPQHVRSLVVTGPLMDQSERRGLQQAAPDSRVSLVEYQENLSSYIAASDLSISMGGYNTVCEVLSAGVPSIIVPRVFPRREQLIRAQLLAAHGLTTVLVPSFLTSRRLAAAVEADLVARPNPIYFPSLNGGRRAAEIICSSVSSSSLAVRRETSC